MAKTAVIFDFDGTIFNSIPWILKAINKLAPSYGREPITEEGFESLRSSTIQDLIKKFKLPFYQIPVLLLKSRHEVEKDLDKIGLYEGMTDVIRELDAKGYKLGILSSSPKKNIEHILLKFGISQIQFVQSEINIFGKSSALLKACADHGIRKENLMYVGDEIRDLQACRKAGIDIISVTWGLNNEEGLRKHGADNIAQKPSDITVILEKYAAI